jgi:hypothetical protein
MMGDIVDVKAALTEGLTELHLPTVRRIYEEAARLAERETLSYERYLLDLVTRESQDRQQKRIQRLLRQSRIPAEKALANFNLKRLPPKVALLTKSLIKARCWTGVTTCWRSAIPGAARRIFSAPSGRS